MTNTTPLFLLGTGRSGTTLIQRFINAHSNAIVWGEHIGFLESMANSYFLLKKHPSMHEYSYQNRAPDSETDLKAFYKNPKLWQAWMNWFKPEDVDDFFRQFLENMLCPKSVGTFKVWGFKEIRYGENTQVINFLQALYPSAVFLCVVRESLNVIESQLTTFHQGTSKYPKIKRILQIPTLVNIAVKWVKMNRTYKLLSQEHNNVIFLKYETFVENYTVIKPLMDKLGLEIEENQIGVLNLKEGRGSSFSPSSNANQRWRKLGYIPAFITETITGTTAQSLNYERPASLILATYLSKLFTLFLTKHRLR
tara:strand:- start:2282 stop:3208 length:927 start_codon:yes stop_codon:yes gene_type:complete